MNLDEFATILSLTPHFSASRNYWLFRTQGGLYYEHFKAGNFIAIGFDEISLYDIYESKKDEKKPYKHLADVIKQRFPEEKKPKYRAAQLFKFTYALKRGDIVIIPSDSSYNITIGEVEDTAVDLIENPVRPSNLSRDELACPFKKRKKVRWFKEIPRRKLDPILYKLFLSHHTVSEANEYSNSIDTLLSDFFIKGDEVTMVLEVKTQSDIKARTLFQMGDSLLEIVDDFCKKNNLDFDTSDVEIKLNLQSPGRIQFRTKYIVIAAIVGIVVISIVGGGFKFESKTTGISIDLSTPGLIQKYIEFQDQQQLRSAQQQILDKHLKTLQVKSPDDLVKILEATKSTGNQKLIEHKENNPSDSNVISGTDSTGAQ